MYVLRARLQSPLCFFPFFSGGGGDEDLSRTLILFGRRRCIFTWYVPTRTAARITRLGSLICIPGSIDSETKPGGGIGDRVAGAEDRYGQVEGIVRGSQG